MFLTLYLDEIFLLTIALSVDIFFAGFSYGNTNIKIPFRSGCIISSFSALSFLIFLYVGRFATLLLSDIATFLGGIILFILGICRLKDSSLLTQSITHADNDKNGTISLTEAFFLGLSLALDAMTAGAGVGTSYYPVFVSTLSIFIGCLLALYLGRYLGKLATHLGKWNFTWIGGAILIFLALKQIFSL